MLSALSPISRMLPNPDSAIFMTIAQGMIDGKLPYVDFFDHKGPLIYFINYFGLLCGGMKGIWLIEILFMSVSVFCGYKIALFFTDKYKAFLAVALTFIVFPSFWRGSNYTEEYVLPFVFISLFIFTSLFFKGEKPGKIKPCILGFCFGVSLLLCPNMFGLWVGFCFVIFFSSIMKNITCRLFYVLSFSNRYDNYCCSCFFLFKS
jgi:hypothetical protein